MTEPTTFDTQKLAEALAEKYGQARAAKISTGEMLAALAQMLRRLNQRSGTGIRA